MPVPAFVAAGAAVSGSGPTSLTPARPAGLITGDVVFVLAGHRDDAALKEISGVSGGANPWTEVFYSTAGANNAGRQRMWWQRHTVGDANPVVTFSGLITGTTGDDAIAQCCAIRNLDAAPVNVVGTYGTHAGAQNITVANGVTPTAPDAGVLVVAQKQDDWTSIAALTGDGYTWSAIGSPISTAGADYGMTWHLGVRAGAPAAVTQKVITVTGGTTARGGGRMVALRSEPNRPRNITVVRATAVARASHF